jgi:hypothetical protein
MLNFLSLGISMALVSLDLITRGGSLEVCLHLLDNVNENNVTSHRFDPF